jgi:glucose/arabinose dehydrogenase
MRKVVAFGFIMLLLIVTGYALYAKLSSQKAAVSTVSPTATPISQLQTTQQDIPAVSTIASGLEVPWAIAFLPDKTMLFTERPGRVRMITANGQLLPDPPLTLSVPLPRDGEGGLLGIAIHPDFSSNHYVYLYYTYASSGNQTKNRVVRYTFANNKLTGETIIVDAIPGALYHDGGRIKFGPDRYLYITTGDSQDPSLAQSTNAIAGKILRVTDDGKAAPGNPFNNLVYSYGHRNPQGIAWDQTGKLWETEHGRSNPTGFDEVNLIDPGKNYGWDIIQGNETKAGMVTPKINSGPTTTWAPSGAAFVGNSLFFAGLKGQTLYEAVIQNNTVLDIKAHLKGQYGRLREAVVGPDGMLYITTSNRDGRGSPGADDDKILRINPTKLH